MRDRGPGSEADHATCRCFRWVVVVFLVVPGCNEKPVVVGATSSLERVHVREVVDGDSVILADGRTVRYLGLDAPEPDTAGHDQARQRNRGLVEDKLAELETFHREHADRYGRVLGVIYVRGDRRQCANVELVRLGLAWVYRRSPDSVPPELLARLLSAQADAFENRRGIWSRLDAATRKMDSPLMSTRLRLHRFDCRHLENAQPRPVRSLESELRAGKSPCRTCRPLW